MVSKDPVVSSVRYNPPVVGGVGISRDRKHGEFTPASPFIVGIVCIISVKIDHSKPIFGSPGRISGFGQMICVAGFVAPCMHGIATAVI